MGKQNRRADSQGFEIRHRRPAGFERKPSESGEPLVGTWTRSADATPVSVDLLMSETAECDPSPCRKRSYGRRPSLRATLRSSYITLMSIDITLM